MNINEILPSSVQILNSLEAFGWEYFAISKLISADFL